MKDVNAGEDRDKLKGSDEVNRIGKPNVLYREVQETVQQRHKTDKSNTPKYKKKNTGINILCCYQWLVLPTDVRTALN